MSTQRDHKTPIDGAELQSYLTLAVEALRKLTPADVKDMAELLVEFKDASDEKDSSRQQASARALVELFTDRTGRSLGVTSIKSAKPAQLSAWMNHVAKTVKVLRTERNMSQAELAVQTGLTQSHVSRIESAMLTVSHRTVVRLAKALGVPVSRIDPSAD
jgi:ribosome-binding protein aMBF1 (putative translation factor)